MSACAVGPSAPRDVLDESSGETLLVSGEPVIFARERTDVAANARDYLSALAVRDDRNGRFATWLVIYRWSTVDKRFGGASGPYVGPLQVSADDRRLSLQPLPVIPPVVNSSGIRLLADADVIPSVHLINNDELRAIATARVISLRYDADQPSLPYHIWKDGRRSLKTWLARVSQP